MLVALGRETEMLSYLSIERTTSASSRRDEIQAVARAMWTFLQRRSRHNETVKRKSTRYLRIGEDLEDKRNLKTDEAATGERKPTSHTITSSHFTAVARVEDQQ